MYMGGTCQATARFQDSDKVVGGVICACVCVCVSAHNKNTISVHSEFGYFALQTLVISL